MLKDEIRFVSAHPDRLHFVWQTHVYLANFVSLGIPARNCVALFGLEPGAEPTPALERLRARFPDADIRLYPDTREPAGHDYPPSIQPHLIAKALADSPSWESELTFFHDCDVVFRRLPDFERMQREHPEACLLSDTRDYIGFEHLQKRSEKIRAERPELPPDDLIHRMCQVVGIDFDLVRQNEKGSGGAQYLLRGVGRRYWDRVYRDSLALHQFFARYLGALDLAEEPKRYVQTWTAGMWAYLWNLWREGLETVVHPELKFLFSGASSREPATLLHMAGLQDELKPSHFDKQDWWELDPTEVLRHQDYLFDHLPDETVAREYARWIHQAAGVPEPPARGLAAARRWRVLAWKTDGRTPMWDVERLRFRFAEDVGVERCFASGEAGATYEVGRAFEDGPSCWGGRPERRPGHAPCLYLGIELDRPAIPEKISITQADGPHCARQVLVQYEDAGRWVTAHVASLDPQLTDQTVLYRTEEGRKARGWRVVAETTASGFAWDVKRLRFLRDNQMARGSSVSSGFAIPDDPAQYGHDHAFDDTASYWGGRADETGCFYLGLEETQALPVNRVFLEQGDVHWAAGIEIQTLDDDGVWETFREVSGLGPGLNDILLFETSDPDSWSSPRVSSASR
jgi:hypothetical protein